MNWMKIQSRQENAIYLALWGLLFAAPVLSMYIRTVNNSMLVFNWPEILMIWKMFAVYLVIFLIHNFLLAPMLIYGRKRVLYTTMIVAIFACFITYQCTHRPKMRRFGPPPMERRIDRGDGPRSHNPYGAHRPPRDFKMPEHVPAVFIGQHDIVAVVILVLMFGMNIR